MNKAYKFRIYPSKEQIELIEKTFGCTRFVYNYFLDQRIETHKTEGKSITYTKQQNQLWDNIYDVFEGKVAKEKIDSFTNGYGTILYFYDEDTVKGLQDKFPAYADRFPDWASQSSGMLQISIWSGLKELGIGASLQHYNPVIDEMVKEMFDLPESFLLKAQMPFGGIGFYPDKKEDEDISKRVKIVN